MSGWVWFWTVVIAIGVGSFVLLVIAVIPLGGRDVWELLRRLGDKTSDLRGPKSEDAATRHPRESRRPGETRRSPGGDPGEGIAE